MRNGTASKTLLSTLLLAAAAVPATAATPAQKCETGKLKVAGNYTVCLHKAQQKVVLGKDDMVAYDAAVTKCVESYSSKWQQLEDSAAGACPSDGDETSVQNFLDFCAASTEEALAGGSLPVDNGAVTLTPSTTDQAIPAGLHDGSGKCEGDADLVAANIASGIDLFGIVGTHTGGGGAGLHQSGQSNCYDSSGTPIACAGTGQDGDVQAGTARSFTDNGDGTITDNVTGLTWEKMSNDGSIHDKDDTYTLDDAYGTKIAALNSGSFAGHSDWRLPNIAELESLKNYAGTSNTAYAEFDAGCAPACTVLDCSCTEANRHWSSTSVEAAPSLGWNVDFGDGRTVAASKGSAYPVRAVRGS
jgi:hypothetical protein